MQSSGYPFITPSSTCLSEDLLFFDTFSHSNSDKDNFDLVQFPSPVVIDLIKIVPLGQPIEAKIPGNVRLGATNPSKCELEFFINDLTKQDAHTMTDLGKFYCSEKETDFNPPLQIQTDGLLLRGSYRTLTLAIFGQIVTYDEKPEDEQAILSAASPPAQTPASPVASEHDISYIVRVDQELIRRARDEEESLEESTLRSGELLKDGSVADNVDINEDAIMDLIENEPVKNRTVLEELSNSEGGTSANFIIRDKKNEDADYSNSSDIDNSSRRSIKEETCKQPVEMTETTENDKQSVDDLQADYDPKEWFFDVDTYTPKPLAYFPDPSLTLQERTLLAHKSKLNQRSNYKETVDKEVEKVKEMFEVLGCCDDLKSEDWVTLLEDLTNDIANMSLSQTVNNGEMLKFLVKQVLCGLDISLALKQKRTGFKVRHLRAGIKLATILFHCGESTVSVLIEAGVVQKVLELYNKDQMSLPLRLLIFKCLNAVCDTVEGVEHVIGHKYIWDHSGALFDDINKRVSDKEQSTKHGMGIGELKTKLEHSQDDQHNNDEQVGSEEKPATDQSSPPKHSIETSETKDERTIGNSLTCYQYMILILLSQPTTRVTIAIGNLIKRIRFYQNLYKLSKLTSTRKDPEESEDSVFESDQTLTPGGSKRTEQTLQVIQDLVGLMNDNCVNIAQPLRYLPAKLQFHIKPTPGDNYLPLFKWFKHFNTIECLNFILGSNRFNHLDMIEIEQFIKLQSLSLTFIKQVLDSPRGTQLFLSSSCCEFTTNLIRTLAEKIDGNHLSHLRIESLPSASLQRDESLLAASCRDMSLKLSYCFKVFSCIDKLFEFHRELISKRGESAPTCDPEKVLHQLYIMSDHPYGLAAIMKHFSCIGNLDCILRFLDMPDYHQKHLEFVKETSIDYVLELVGTFFRLNNNVLEIAEEYLDTLVDLCKTKDKNLSVRIKSLLPWLSPFDVDQQFPLITYSEDTFRQLTRVIRKSIPDRSIPFAKGLNFELPPQMITAVRILRQLCIPPKVESFNESNFDVFSALRFTTSSSNAKPSSFLAFVDCLPHQQNQNQSWNLNPHTSQNYPAISIIYDESLTDQLGQLSNLTKLFQPYDETICGDLKYHYGIMQVFEQEGLKRLLNTLRELVGNYPRPIYQSAALCGFRGRIVISYIHSVILLLHSITCHLIDARGKEFKDTSIIPVILETYSLLSFVPKPDLSKINELMQRCDLNSLQRSITIKSDNYQQAQQTKKLILSILMSYTQMCLSVSESEENVISKSMWTKMLSEVVDFTLTTPVFFHHGLDVLTKILPPPLPSQSILDSIDQEQLFKNINHRKLWSAHLHPLHQKIEQMISSLSICCQTNIRTLLHYLCNQLCDLSSNAACMVAKTLMDTLVSCVLRLSLDNNGGIPSSEHIQNNPVQQTGQTEDRFGACVILGSRECIFGIKMIMNLLSNLITNQAFETALSNYLQVISKKDEKLLTILQNAIKTHDNSKANETIVVSDSSNSATVTNLIESIKAISEANSSSKDAFAAAISQPDVTPPDEMTKINLIQLARKTSDRFDLAGGIVKTYRLKVLLDINSRTHRSNNETSSKRFDRSTPHNHQELLVPPSSHKAYVAPIRGRNRQSSRPDSFRSRPQNTSRPPSIHVDDFIDIYGDNSGAASRHGTGGGRGSVDYRASSSSRGYSDHLLHGDASMTQRHPFFSPQPPPPPVPGQQQPPSAGGSYGSRSQHMKSKYMKMK